MLSPLNKSPSSMVVMLHSIPNKSSSFMIALFPTICPCGRNVIKSNSHDYSVLYSRDTPFQLNLPQWSSLNSPINLFQYLITETSTWGYTLKSLSISFLSYCQSCEQWTWFLFIFFLFYFYFCFCFSFYFIFSFHFHFSFFRLRQRVWYEITCNGHICYSHKSHNHITQRRT